MNKKDQKIIHFPKYPRMNALNERIEEDTQKLLKTFADLERRINDVYGQIMDTPRYRFIRIISLTLYMRKLLKRRNDCFGYLGVLHASGLINEYMKGYKNGY